MFCRTSSSGPENRSGDARDAGGFDAHQRRRAHDDQQHEGGERQRDDVVEADGAGAPQDRRAAHALSRHPRRQRRDCLQQPAARAFPQLRLGRRRTVSTRTASPARRQHRREPVGELADRRADRRDLALECPVPDGVTTKRKLRSTGAGRPLKLTLAWACRTRLPAASSSSRCMFELDRRVGRGRDGAGSRRSRCSAAGAGPVPRSAPGSASPPAARPTNRST